jgi:4'-phosphopantetheinyl transferase
MLLEDFARPSDTPLPAVGAVARWLDCATIPPHRLTIWREFLDAEELARADRFYFVPDRETFIAAHALTRAMLSHHGGLPPQAWRFVAGPHGRPSRDPSHNRPDLHFNLSHTTGLVACALAHQEVGVDVESVERSASTGRIAGRFFTPPEVALIDASPETERQRVFFRLWTMKEAVMKAMGLGFQLPLDEFSITLDPLGVTFEPARTDNNTGWSFGQRPVGPHFMLAVALRADMPAVFDIAELT